MLGAMDTSFLVLYSIGLFVSGQLGDHKNPKVMLIISFFCVATVTLVISICGIKNWTNVFFFAFLFSVNGLMQSVGWPCLNAIFANWFGKRGRGTIIGFWQSCGNFGNVAGALLTSFLTSTIRLEWEYTYLFIGQLCFLFAIINIFALIVHPEERGIQIEEFDDKMNQHEEMLRRHTLQLGNKNSQEEVQVEPMSNTRNYETINSGSFK